MLGDIKFVIILKQGAFVTRVVFTLALIKIKKINNTDINR